MTEPFKVCDPVFIRPLGRRGIITWVHAVGRPLYRVASYGEIGLFEASSLAPLEPLMRLVASRTPAPQENSAANAPRVPPLKFVGDFQG